MTNGIDLPPRARFAEDPPDELGVDFDVDDDPLGVPKGVAWAVVGLVLLGIGYLAGRLWP